MILCFQLPSSAQPRLFSFMNPLAFEIWLYVLAAYVLVSFTMFVMARFSPFEWNNPHPCELDNDIVENQFTVCNSFWFITGILLRQGSGHSPRVSWCQPQRVQATTSIPSWRSMVLAHQNFIKKRSDFGSQLEFLGKGVIR